MSETHVVNGIGNEAAQQSSFATRRGIFEKYTDAQKSTVFWKFSLALTVLSLTLSVLGLALDRYDSDDEAELTLDGHKVVVPSIMIRSTAISLGTEGCHCPTNDVECHRFKVSPNRSPLHTSRGMSFLDLYDNGKGDPAAAFFADDSRQVITSTHLGSFNTMYSRGLASRILAYIGVALQAAALIWSLVFRVGPAPFFYNRPLFGQSQREHILGSIYLLLLVSSAVMLFASNAVMSTFIVPLLGRVANFALSWCRFSPFDSLDRQQTSLDYMLYLGDYVQDHANATGVTFVTYAISTIIIFGQTMFVSYLGCNHVRLLSSVRYHLPRTQLMLLPWFSKIIPLGWSLLLLAVGIVAKCGAAYSARIRGYELNMFFYQNAFSDGKDSRTWSLPDIILDDTHKYVIDKSLITILLSYWIPAVLVIGAGTVDYMRYISKIIQIWGVLFLIGAAVSVVTVPPTPVFFFEKPQCFRPPQQPPTFKQFFSMKESCNDQIFSIYTCLVFVPVMMYYFFIRYGPVNRKISGYIFLVLSSLASMYLIIATRQSYTVDVYIGALVSVLVCLSQSAAFKLLLRFGAVHPGMNNKPPIVLSDKIVPMLDDVIKRIELHFMAGDKAEPISKDDMDLTTAEFARVAEALAVAKQQAIQELVPHGLSEAEGMTSLGDTTDEEDTKNKDV
jgi:hypothetical protein